MMSTTALSSNFQIYEALSTLSGTCTQVMDSYWKMFYQLKRFDMMIVIPMIIFSAFTSISAITQLIGGSLPLQIITIILSLIVTILAGAQKYLEFDRRSVISKQVAKRWGSVKGKIDFFLLSFSSITDHSTLLIIIHSIFNDIDAIGGSLEDVPDIAEVPKKMTAVRELLADFHTQV
jgi:hypothetical protein